MPRHFLTLGDLSRSELDALLARAAELKQAFRQRRLERSCPGRVLAMAGTWTRRWYRLKHGY